MYQVDDDPKLDEQPEAEPLETIHLYVVREGQPRPSLVPVLISILALFILIAIGTLTPYQQPEQRTLLRVPAVLLPLKTFTANVPIIPTGIKTYPATIAHGILTVTNGSILAEELPKGMILTSKDGAEIITDTSVFVTPGSATGLGYATVEAHAAVAGAAGNISALDINVVEGTALFIRNVQPFTGGENSYSTKFITFQDRESALSKARVILQPQTFSGFLQSPCNETITGSQTIQVRWKCQFVTYITPSFPGIRVLSAQVKGTIVLLDIVYLLRPQRIETK